MRLIMLLALLVQLGGAQQPPALLVKSKKGHSEPLRVDELKVEVNVVGNVAETIMTLEFRNDTERVLEGELIFPLGEGQTISDYALEIDGKMRAGVVVEKERAREVFEEVVRGQIDPGLIEWTKGNNFRTRIYPIPAKGTKRVRLAYQEVLTSEKGGLQYMLPLNFQEKLARFSLQIEAQQSLPATETFQDASSGLTFSQMDSKVWTLTTKEKNYAAKKPVVLTIPLKAEPLIAVEKREGDEFYFHLVDQAVEIPVQDLGDEKFTTALLVWDASGSGALRDHKKELQVLKSFLGQHPGITVDLELLRHRVEKVGQFKELDALEKALREISYDGGTSPGELDLSLSDHDVVLFVSDGIGTLGKGVVKVGKHPVHIFHAAESAQHETLRQLARESGGSYQNLRKVSVEDALRGMQAKSPSLISIMGGLECFPSVASPIPGDGLMTIAGKIRGKLPVELTLNYGVAGEILESRKITIDPSQKVMKGDRVSRIWAGLQLVELMGQSDENREAIVELGKSHGILTPFTSLLVLDRLEDYVRYRIEPPTAVLRVEYRRKLKELEETKEPVRDHLNQLVESWSAMVKWHEKKFDPIDVLFFHRLVKSKDEAKDLAVVLKKGKSDQARKRDRVAIGEVQAELDELQRKLAELASVELLKRREAILSYTAKFRELRKTLDEVLEREGGGDDVDGFAASGGAAEERPSAPLAALPIEIPSMGGDGDGDEGEPVEASISLAKWDPKAPYLEALKKASADEWESVYFQWKKKHLDSSAFYLDVSDFFMAKKKPELALRILTNIAELDLENVPLMRILAHRLHQLGENERALAIFDEVFDLRPDEPQSRRDLALVLGSLDRHQEAADLLWKVISSPIDERFDGIQLISLVELNAMVSRYRLRTSGYDSRLIKNLDCDARIILTWDADNTDIDLWVTDTLAEKCFYGHNLSESGGRMSNDFTDGYGPEEFLIREAMHGKYRVEVNYYGNRQQVLAGATTVQVTVFTNWGRKNQKSEVVTLRLKDSKEVVFVGEFELR